MTITKGTQPKEVVATMVSLVKLLCDGGPGISIVGQLTESVSPGF